MSQRGPAVRAVLVPLLVLALALGTAWWASARDADTRSSLTSGLDALPAGTQVAGFTDWAAIRSALGLGRASTAAGRAALTDDATLRDLTTRSVIGQAIDEMHRLYGWSAADLDWETYGRATAGSAMVARLSGSVSLDAVKTRLSKLGYTRSGDTWTLSSAGRAAVGPDLASALGFLAVLDRERVVVATDRPAYVPVVVGTIRGDRESLLSVRPAADVASSLAGSDAAVVQGPGFGCSATSLAGKGADVTAQAAAALARAGRLQEPTFTGRGLVEGDPDQTITFASAFPSPAVAADQARVRAVLARGPFIGRTGRIEDSLTGLEAGAQGSVTTLRFTLDPDRGTYMTGEGPLLFASCP
ncbi:MAG: hypothetical protein JWR27_6 [Aeromicrobium sp.]|nr:hypothetical protein [Aeromicrobium sp.]